MLDASPAWNERGEPTAQQLYLAGRDHLFNRDLHFAASLLRASAELCPHYKTLELLGECLIELRDYRSSIIPLAAATGLNIQARAPFLLATTLLELGELQESERFARMAIARNPNYVLAKEILKTIHQRMTSQG